MQLGGGADGLGMLLKGKRKGREVQMERRAREESSIH